VIHADHAMLVAGGKGLNMALGVARLGAKATLLSVIGDDTWGRTLMRQIEELLLRLSVSADITGSTTGMAGQIDLDNVLTVAAPTPLCGVLTNRTVANPAFIGTKQLPIWSGLSFPQEWREVIENSQVLIACLAFPVDIVCDAIRIAHDSEVLVVLNPGPPPRDSVEYQRLADILEYVDVMVPNDYEARRLIAVGKNHVPDTASPEIAERLQESISCDRIGLVCITKGREGFDAVYCATQERDDEASFRKRRFRGKVTAITTDPVGRGDAYCAALAVELANGKTPEYALRFAAAAASVAMRTSGAAAAMPDRNDVLTALSRRRVTVTESFQDDSV
jgi:ribokinase